MRLQCVAVDLLRHLNTGVTQQRAHLMAHVLTPNTGRGVNRQCPRQDSNLRHQD